MTELVCRFKVGDLVRKVGGDYSFVGYVVSVFAKLSGAVRLVVEDDRGVLHVYSEKNLAPVEAPANKRCPWSGMPCDCEEFPWTRDGKIPKKCAESRGK